VETAARIAENCLFGKFSESERRKIIEYGLFIIEDRASYEALCKIDIESSIISYEGGDRKISGIVFRCKSRVGFSSKKESENILYIPDRHLLHIQHTLDTHLSISYYTHLANSFSNYLQNLNISSVIFESEAPVYHKDVLSLLNIDLYEVMYNTACKMYQYFLNNIIFYINRSRLLPSILKYRNYPSKVRDSSYNLTTIISLASS